MLYLYADSITIQTYLKMKKKEQPELSYYGLYLLRYLLEQHSRKAKDLSFIYSREQLAAETFEQALQLIWMLVLVVIQTLVRNMTFTEALSRPYNYFLASIAFIGTFTAMSRKEKK